MALLFYDGFEYNGNNGGAEPRSLGWIEFNANTWFDVGRFGAGAIVDYSNECAYSIPEKSELVTGMAYRGLDTNYSSGKLMSFKEGATQHIIVGYNPTTQALTICRGDLSTVLATITTSKIPLNVWTYIELKGKIHSTTGYAEVRINGTLELSVYNVNTRNGGNGVCNRVSISNNKSNCDDFYICDLLGDVNNDFLGDVKVLRLNPVAAGDLTQCTPSTGANWQCVDEDRTDGDSTYVTASASGNKDLYAVEDLTSTPQNIYGVMAYSIARKDDAGDANIRNIIKTGGTIYEGTASGLSTTYQALRTVFEKNPNGNTAWTRAAIDSLQVGIERTL